MSDISRQLATSRDSSRQRHISRGRSTAPYPAVSPPPPQQEETRVGSAESPAADGGDDGPAGTGANDDGVAGVGSNDDDDGSDGGGDIGVDGGRWSSCGARGVTFSRNQRRKPPGERRCDSCPTAAESPSVEPRDGFAELKSKSEGDGDGEGEGEEDDDEDGAGGWSPPAAELPDDGDGDRGDGLEDTPAKASPRAKGPEELRPKGGPLDRMRRARDRTLGGSGGGEEDEEGDEGHASVSVEALKRENIGRSVSSMYDVDRASEAAEASSGGRGGPSGSVAGVAALADGEAAADRLRRDVTCPVCQDPFYEPTSLPCGHSFCRSCLTWWIEKRRGPDGSTCPTCREPIPGSGEDDDGIELRTNVALKAVMIRRRTAEEREKRKAWAGEAGGAQDRGSEEVVPLAEDDEVGDYVQYLETGRRGRCFGADEGGWIPLRSAAPGTSQCVYVRRNVVLDDSDQRYQLSLALSRCTLSGGGGVEGGRGGGVIDAKVCLLSMEEDEIEDSGFSVYVAEGDDDEAPICTSGEKIHAIVEASARVMTKQALERAKERGGRSVFGRARDAEDGREVREVPLSRGAVGRDGSARFRIDLGRALKDAVMDDGDDGLGTVKLRFRHVDTGAVLELRLPPDGVVDDSEISFGGSAEPASGAGGASRFLLNEEEEDERDEPNEYVEDDFLVNRSQDSEEEFHSDDEHDEEDACRICENGGDLIVCDGADRGGGEVPPGDWICVSCAKDVGIDVGIEGHEWEALGEESSDDELEMMPRKRKAGEPLVLDGSDDDDDVRIPQARKKKGNEPLVLDHSDDEIVPARKKGGRPLVLDSSDDEDENGSTQNKTGSKAEVEEDSIAPV
ncbi:hypothetical protein ACHAWF_015044 [Thalassiosira exigua]